MKKNPEMKNYDFTDEKGNPGRMVFKSEFKLPEWQLGGWV